MPISINNISFKYENGNSKILENVNLDIKENETIAILGKSGAGKSTLLNIISNFYYPLTGEIELNGIISKDITYIRQSAIEMLFPWKNVQENVDFSLIERNQFTESNKKRNAELLKILKLDDKKKQYPSELSGGEKKRLSFSCGLSYSPKLILLDEAFTGIDFSLKWELWAFLRTEIEKLKAEAIIVTHDFDEALLLADKIVFLNPNKKIDDIVIDTKGINKKNIAKAISSNEFNELKIETLKAYNKINEAV
ncbi:MAG: ATP-binding cassette domain-containing protein [Flavobacteriaceae bacterium]|nr:MAG: ATP-binding cassette domain-containing protein [Flavobacteriaceae bacterium]